MLRREQEAECCGVLGCYSMITFFFFFQAEDGIRDLTVTGVQTCALPILAVAYSLLWQGHFWERFPRPWQVALSIVFFVLASLLSWTGARALGRQWRIDADRKSVV